MAEARTFVAGAPVWVDLSSTDPAAARDFYSRLFGWKIDVMDDPAAGGYAMAVLDGKQVAGVGPTQSPQGPSAWMVYIGTEDAEATAKKVQEAGGKVIAEPFDVFKAGRMAVCQDPVGTFFAVWQPGEHRGAELTGIPGAFSWAELNARGLERAKPFYMAVFGWGDKTTTGAMPYTEWQLAGNTIAGAMEMAPAVPAEVPSHWMVYFGTDDVDRTAQTVTELGGRTLMEPRDFPGGRFAIVQDPRGAVFGLLKMQR